MYPMLQPLDPDQSVPLNLAYSDTEKPPGARQFFSSEMHYMQFCSSRVDLLFDKATSAQPRPLSAIPAGFMSDNFVFPPSSDATKLYASSQATIPHNYPVFAVNSLPNQFNQSAADECASKLQPHMLISGSKNTETTIFDRGFSFVQEDDSSKDIKLTRENFNYSTGEMPYSSGGQTTKDGIKLVNRPADARARAAKVSKIRKARIDKGLKALQGSIPCSNQGKKDSQLDDVIDYIKFLKLQLKVLSQSRLSGEAAPFPFVYLEGYGHYLLFQETCDEPLEETMSQLMESDIQAATNLLESKGLFILPTALAFDNTRAI